MSVRSFTRGAFFVPTWRFTSGARPRARPEVHVLWLRRSTGKRQRTPDSYCRLRVCDWLDDRVTPLRRVRRVLRPSPPEHPAFVAADPCFGCRLRCAGATPAARRVPTLRRGKVVITDRLHAHVLCLLLGIPHVLLDNNYGKVRGASPDMDGLMPRTCDGLHRRRESPPSRPIVAEPMMVSLVVSTRNRAMRLPESVSLSRLEAPAGGWELILVHNGSTDEPLKRFVRSCGRSCFPSTACKPPRRDYRMRATRKTHTPRVASSPSPTMTAIRSLTTCARLWMCSTAINLGVLGGRVLGVHNPADARVWVWYVPTALTLPRGRSSRPGVMHGANMAVRREVLDDIGGFDPLLGAGTRCMAAEDTDFVARAVWAGWTARHDSGARGGAPPRAQARRRGGSAATSLRLRSRRILRQVGT